MIRAGALDEILKMCAVVTARKLLVYHFVRRHNHQSYVKIAVFYVRVLNWADDVSVSVLDMERWQIDMIEKRKIFMRQTCKSIISKRPE